MGSTESWYVRPTGNMTLSVLSAADGLQILRTDLLSANVLPAGDNAQRLLVLWNDLELLAAIPDLLAFGVTSLRVRDPDAGHSPFAWELTLGPDRRSVTVSDGVGRTIAKRSFPKRLEENRLSGIVSALTEGIALLNVLASNL